VYNRELKRRLPSLLVECLTPDFRGQSQLIGLVASSGLDVYAHNLETVERLQRRVRDHRAGYSQSLHVLEAAKARVPTLVTKTSLMLGVGETDEDVRATLRDLRAVGCDVVTFGQYLQPTKRHMPVHTYVTPHKFNEWKVRSGPRAPGWNAAPDCDASLQYIRRRLTRWASSMWRAGLWCGPRIVQGR
jgi:lipoic acid synthetase